MRLCKDDIVLRSFEERDIENKVRWINNPENNQYLHYQIPLEVEKTRNWFLHKKNETRLDLVIEYQGIPVGLIGLLAIDPDNQKAEFYISMGETAYKRKGISTRAIQILLEYAFVDLRLNKVYLNVDADNEAACGLYEKTGFLCEGTFVEDMYHRGKLIDRKRYAILRKAYLEFSY